MAILTADELASVRREYRAASLLPARTYQDPAVLDWEREHILQRDWLAVGRAEEVPEPGSFLVRDVLGESVLLVRGRDDEIRAFYNVCRHRGTAVEERECGKAVRFQCPYHAWIYELDGSLVRAKHTEDLDDFSLDTYGLAPIRCETWQGFVFLCFADESVTAGLETQLGDLVDNMARFDFTSLRSAKQIVYEVGSNWKLIAENYSECYHCPGVHPQLNKLTPYDLGGDFDPNGAWQGGWMELVEGAETMALDGGHGSRDGRPPMCGITTTDEQRVYYYVLWPHDVPVDPPGLPAGPSPGPRRQQPHPGRVRLAVRGRDHRRRRLRPVGRDRVLGPHQPPGLARVRAPAARDGVAELGRRPLLEPGGIGAGVRPDGRRPLRGGRRREPARHPRALQHPAAQADHERRQRHPHDGRRAAQRGRRRQPIGLTRAQIPAAPLRWSLRRAPSRQAAKIRIAVTDTMIVEIALISGVTPNRIFE